MKFWLRQTPLILGGATCIAFIMIRPSPSSFTFWALLIGTLVFGLANTAISISEIRADKRARAKWRHKFEDLGVAADVIDDGHLQEYFTETEWKKIFLEVERLPKESRSLRKIIVSKQADFFENYET